VADGKREIEMVLVEEERPARWWAERRGRI
jgi:hypothetical protein